VTVVLIALGGALGSVARYALSTFVLRSTGSLFPLGTFVVNLVGCFVFGAIAGAAEQRIALPPEMRARCCSSAPSADSPRFRRTLSRASRCCATASSRRAPRTSSVR